MHRLYTDKNVYEAFLERMDFIFREFDNILISFSGGKDSGLLLNMTLDFKRKYYPNKRIGLYHQDFEAQYSYTTEYVKKTFEELSGEVDAYWVCLPTATRTALSSYEAFWYPWDDEKQELWVRDMPKGDYVINIENNPISTYQYKMHQEDLAKQFVRWYASEREGNTVCLLGIRAEESLNRYNAIVNKRYGYKGQCYITKQVKNCWTASPMYDWSVRDVWAANAKFGYSYNKLYDLYFKAGLSVDKMRVASPFNEHAVEALNLYRVIEPKTWARLVGRVRGVNFGAIYGRGKGFGRGGISLPSGYTWKEYTKFLLSTLPASIRNMYISKFVTSIEFWHKTGGGLSQEVISELIEKGYNIEINGVSNYTIKKLPKVVFVDRIPDHTDDITTTKDIPSWKRMCLCILKNDHLCRGMGFGLSREQKIMVEDIKKKYNCWLNPLVSAEKGNGDKVNEL